jgi:hypothetical protein
MIRTLEVHDRYRGFADPALLIEDGDFHRSLSLLLPACRHQLRYVCS